MSTNEKDLISYKAVMNSMLVALLWLLMSSTVIAVEQVVYYHTDALGSVVATTDENGDVLWRESYRPFGGRIENAVSTKDNTPFYTGKPHDDETGLSYFGARYYDPLVGRFTGFDPVGVDPGNLHSFNRYAYANNNPYRYVDPDGNASVAVGVIGLLALNYARGALIGGGVSAAIQYTSTGNVNWGDVGTDANFGGLLGLIVPGLSTTPGIYRGQTLAPKKAPDITTPYKRPSGATTKAQRESVQGKPCVDCGATTPKQFADHKDPLVKEYYRTGTIDKTRMRDIDSVQPQCPTCSSRQGAGLSRFSRQQKKDLRL